MSAYGTSKRFRRLIEILHVPFAQRLRIDDIIDILPHIYEGNRDSAHRKIGRDIGALEEIGFIVERYKLTYWIVGYAWPDENMKRCNMCKRKLPPERFSRGQHRCKGCHNRYMADRRLRLSESELQKKRAYKREYQKGYFKRRYHSDPVFREKHLRGWKKDRPGE